MVISLAQFDEGRRITERGSVRDLLLLRLRENNYYPVIKIPLTHTTTIVFWASPWGLVGQEKWRSTQTYFDHRQLALCCPSVRLSVTLSIYLSYISPPTTSQRNYNYTFQHSNYCGVMQRGELMHYAIVDQLKQTSTLKTYNPCDPSV